MQQLKITNKITKRESISLDKYLNDISKIDLLTVNEETDLAKRIREGDEEALEKLTKANLRFVVSVAKQYQNQGLSLSDLINEGNVGLMKAAKRFDETRGFKFISYAVWWIRQSILSAIVEYSRLVRLPINKVSSYNSVNTAIRSLSQELEREPSDEELAEELELKLKDVVMLRTSTGRHISTDAPVNSEDGNESTILDIMVNENQKNTDDELEIESLHKTINLSLSNLSKREQEILNSYYGLNGQKSLTFEDVGDLYGLTRERVRQIKERAIRRLRKSVNKKELKSFLGK